jgi:hypothetical protein
VVNGAVAGVALAKGVESGASAVGLVQHVGWLDPVGRHGNGLTAHT